MAIIGSIKNLVVFDVYIAFLGNVASLVKES